MKGLLIVFEGIDGAGKTTQINLLRDNLIRLGNQILLTREPGGTRTGEIIRGFLLDPANKDLSDRTEAFLYAAARAQHVEEKIKPALSMGKIVLCDRFTDSTLAYQGFGRKQDLNFLNKLNQLAAGGLKPDLTILLDLPTKVGLSRIKGNLDRLEQESISFYERVREGYLEISSGNSRYHVFNAGQKAQETSQKVLDIVKEYL